ncbi:MULTISPECIES: NADH-quinone oxidoreductase subunit N [unclassified Meiothermus]|uniref:NADH-quinone oxidoreductase subunit N n=1 Tax=unclassified Meiothermus TaxID=370471 RepID=UPI000D7CFDAD|nr:MULTISPECIES: NADH-quinone oxidoreductase subunit N [unclassified Meiothermus]PZA07344.1 NADH-quinone oxidoreductase subunit N [Meiothermus sp. Pnk-1]RYM37338.1 NADH-quinone oxidoreductase subunit N [Meiothermus sp. PNK-Is4]
MIPLLILSSAAAVLTLLALWIPLRVTKWLTAGSVLVAVGAILVGWNQTAEYFGLFRWDSLAQGLTLVALLGVLWAVVIGRETSERAEYYLLALYAAVGMLLMASTPNLVVILIALEALSLPLYVLATWRRDEQSYEAGLKYFLLGAISAAIFLYGIALHFGATGSFNAGTSGSGALYTAAMVLLLIGLAFKASMVPFHWWTPDVYQGSPTGVSLLMATAVKAAAFAALVRLTSEGLPAWGAALAAVIVLTLIFGNLGALAQSEAKRLLAYSSIAHAGYVGIGLYSATAAPAIGFYLLTYLLGTGLAFAVLSAISNGNVPYERLRGLFGRNRFLGIGLGFAMLSLTGLPPFPGFWGKLLVFLEGAKAHQYPLLVLALVTSAIAAYYYLRLFSLALLSRQPEDGREEDRAGVLPPWPTATPAFGSARWAMTLAMVLIGLLGILPFLGYRAFAAGQPDLAVRVPLNTNLSITSPSDGAEVPAGGFSLQGTGQPGETLEIYDGATKLGSVTVEQNGGWSFALEPAPSPGLHTYQVRRAGQAGGPSVRVKVTAPSSAVPGHDASAGVLPA